MTVFPLSYITTPDQTPVACLKTPTGWHLPAPKGLRAAVRFARDAILCRIRPGGDRDVVQLGIGRPGSRLCDALYSPSRDQALVFAGDELELLPAGRRGVLQVACRGPLTLTLLRDYMKVHRNLPWFRPMDRRRFPAAPAGWCSWYYYYLRVNEEQVVRNTDWLAENLRKFGCEYVQIDDGWQGRGEGFGTNRDWFTTCQRDFPRGMKWCADYIRSRGFRPGIWCIPFTQSDTTMYERQPELFVRAEDGRSPGERTEPLDYAWMPQEERRFDWAGRYYIDPTGPAGEQYLRRLLDMLCKEWGYDYVKIDAQGMMADFLARHRRRLAEPSLDGERAYRRGLEVIRSVMGPERFLLNCGVGWASCGLCEGIRIGGDVGLSWQGMQWAFRSTMEWLFLNTLAFYTDPDVVCVRPPLTLEQARLWATLTALTGQVLMASDQMYDLSEERVELLRRVFPVADIRPMELYPVDPANKPAIFDVKVRLPRVGSWDVVAVFNWSEGQARAIDLWPGRLGLPEGRWICLDGWTGQLLHHGDGKIGLIVPPAECRVVSYWPDLGRPQVVGTSRHITQGAVDLQAVRWDADRRRLTGRSKVVGGDPYRVRLFVPQGWQAEGKGVQQQGELAELVLRTADNRTLSWSVDFRQA